MMNSNLFYGSEDAMAAVKDLTNDQAKKLAELMHKASAKMGVLKNRKEIKKADCKYSLLSHVQFLILYLIITIKCCSLFVYNA